MHQHDKCVGLITDVLQAPVQVPSPAAYHQNQMLPSQCKLKSSTTLIYSSDPVRCSIGENGKWLTVAGGS